MWLMYPTHAEIRQSRELHGTKIGEAFEFKKPTTVSRDRRRMI
jgi:hypothetical protein